MYESFYGLREPAFTLTPNPEFLYLNERNREALKQLLYGIERREGFAVITGDVGTGKTTLCWALMEKLEEKQVQTALIQKPMFSDTDMLRSILQDLGVRPGTVGNPPETSPPAPFDSSWMAGLTKKDLIDRLDAFLMAQAQLGIFTVVIIDEAQNLSMEGLEQLRLLSNLETAKTKLLQFVFVGQLELEQKLTSPALRQLNQRIAYRFVTRTLSRKDTEYYIRHRLRIAGASPKLQFERGAFAAIHRYSKGYPRLINMICDRSLFCAFQQQSFVLSAKMVRRGYRSIREPFRRRISIWIKWGLPVAGSLVLTLSAVAFLSLKKPTLHPTAELSPVSQPLPPVSAPVVLAETQPKPSAAPAPEPAGNKSVAAPAEIRDKILTPVENPRPAPAQISSGEPAADGYLLQIYSFRKSESAKAEAARLTKAGYPSFSKLDGNDGSGNWFAVYVGPYEDLSSARKAASTLRSSQAISPVLRRIGP